MSQSNLDIVVLGLSISSAWGNGHATTYRALVRGLGELGHDVLFLERDVPWYASNRDEPEPRGCRLALYDSLSDLDARFREEVRSADAVIVGSYVPDGIEVLRWVQDVAEGSVLFYDIDTPITLGALRRNEPTYIARESIPGLDGYLSFTGGSTLAYIEKSLGAKRALPLYCSVDAGAYLPRSASPTHDLGYLGTYSADRQAALETLLNDSARRFPQGRFVVAGSCYPECGWPSNVERIDHVPPPDHPAFYGSLRFTLNLTRADMRKSGYAPSVRLFEAAACGVPVITDVWPGIEEFFEPGREILVARDSEDVMRILVNLPESERRAIGERARARFLRQHTGLHRARTLESYLFELRSVRQETDHGSRARNSATVAVVSQPAPSGWNPNVSGSRPR